MNDYDDEAQTELLECVDREIGKYEGLISSQAQRITEDCVKICDHRTTYNEAMNKHCELMKRYFGVWKDMTFATADDDWSPEKEEMFLKKLRIIYGLVKANACEVEEHMRELCGLEIYTENEYNDLMVKFKQEIDAFDSFVKQQRRTL